MTVLFVSHTPQVGGAESVLLKLIDEALNRAMSVVVACPSGELSARLPTGVRHVRIDPLGLRGESGASRVSALVRLAYRWCRAGREIRRLTRTPDTTTVVNSLFALPSVRIASPRGPVSWLIHDTITATKQKFAIRIGRSVLDTCVAVSEPTAAAARVLGLEVSVSNLGVYIPDTRTIRDPLDWPGTPAIVGSMGVITHWKGHHILLDSVAATPGVVLEIAGRAFDGDDDYEKGLRTRASLPDLRGRVRFLGQVDAQGTMSRWDILVSASVEPEAGPLVALEAMSLGVPVIGTDHGGTRALLADDCGLLVPPGDATALAQGISYALAEPATTRDRTIKARQRTENRYDMRRNLPKMLSKLVD